MEDYQNRLFPYAYNILGSVEDAKDVIQDVISKHLVSDHTAIENTTGYLVKSVINHAINTKKRNQKLVADAIWLPEPVATDRSDTNINSEEIITYSLLVMLERLTARERAVFILKEAFDYSHSEIGNLLDISIENARKLLSRSKKKVHAEGENSKATVDKKSVSHLEEYIEAIRNRDVKSLEKILNEDITVAADGGDQIRVVREFTVGRTLTMKLLLHVYQTYQEFQRIEIGEVNHQPALLYYENGKMVNCQVFELDSDRSKVDKIFTVLAPNKLASFN